VLVAVGDPGGLKADSMKVDGPGLRRRREDAGLTLTALAHAASISKTYLSLVETGQRPGVSPPVAARLAQALGVAIADLRSGVTDDP
jgi:transcriptional regulator with XRE-family HTH domain